MKDGRLVQVGTPQELYGSPTNAFVAEFMGPTNLIEGKVVAVADGWVHVATGMGEIVAAAGPASGPVTVSIRPELISIFARGDGKGGSAGGGVNVGSGGNGASGGNDGSGRNGGVGSSAGVPWEAGFVAAGGRAGVNRLIGTVVEDTFLGSVQRASGCCW